MTLSTPMLVFLGCFISEGLWRMIWILVPWLRARHRLAVMMKHYGVNPHFLESNETRSLRLRLAMQMPVGVRASSIKELVAESLCLDLRDVDVTIDAKIGEVKVMVPTEISERSRDRVLAHLRDQLPSTMLVTMLRQ